MGRKLSPNEHLLYVIDQVVSQHMVIVVRLSGILTEPVLRQALDIIQDKHPYLQWKIVDGEDPEFIPEGVPKIPLQVMERQTEDHWVEVAEKELNDLFPLSEGPLARVVLLSGENKCDLILTVCHIASDGISLMPFVKVLLNTAAKLANGESVEPFQRLPVPPPSIEALRKDLTFKPEPTEDTGSSVQGGHKFVDVTPYKNLPPEDRITRLVPFVLPPDDTKKLASLCKAENTSMQGALCAAFMQSVVEQYRNQDDKDDPLLISCITPVNLRHLFTNPTEEDFGYYISFAIHTDLVHENASFWPLAKQIKDTLVKEIEHGRDIKAIRGVADLLETHSNAKEILQALDERNPPVIVTNLGRINIPDQYGDLMLEEINASGAIQAHTKMAIAITTFRGHLTINLLYSYPYISKEIAVKLADNTMERLKNAIK